MTDRLRETDAKPLTPEEIKLIAADPRGYEASFGHHAVRDRLLATIERQGEALRAVGQLCFQREQMMAGEPNPAFAAQLTTAEIRAALAQTEPQA